VSFTIHLVVNTALSDICYEIDGIATAESANAGSNSTNVAGLLSTLIPCSSNSPAFSAFTGLIDQGINAAVATACTGLHDACDATSGCDPIAYSNPCNVTVLKLFLNSVKN
jgi:hypothetical protein